MLKGIKKKETTPTIAVTCPVITDSEDHTFLLNCEASKIHIEKHHSEGDRADLAQVIEKSVEYFAKAGKPFKIFSQSGLSLVTSQGRLESKESSDDEELSLILDD